MRMVILFLTCANDSEAEKISLSLLEKQLIVCAKRSPVSTASYWKGSIEKSTETLLIMESVEEKYDEIEKEVRKLHSYETFVLTVVPVLKTSKRVNDWLNEGLKK